MAHQKGRVPGSHRYTRLDFLTRPLALSIHTSLCPGCMYFMQVISIHICLEFEAFPNLEHITHQWGTEGPTQVSRLPRALPYIFDHARLFVSLLPSLFLSKRSICLITLSSPTAHVNPFLHLSSRPNQSPTHLIKNAFHHFRLFRRRRRRRPQARRPSPTDPRERSRPVSHQDWRCQVHLQSDGSPHAVSPRPSTPSPKTGSC